MWPNPNETANLVTFTEEINNGKLHFFVQWSTTYSKWLVYANELKNTPTSNLISWCGNFVGTNSLHKVSDRSPKTLQKMCVSKKFLQQEICWNCIILHNILCFLIVLDLDECRTRTHECQQHCLNRYGSYSCMCMRGYQLSSHGKTCSG